MPYIQQKIRKKYQEVLDYLNHFVKINCPGELNYILFKIILQYIRDKRECYQTYNDVIGVLECIKQELYRRFVSKYEDLKIKQNGDIVEKEGDK